MKKRDFSDPFDAACPQLTVYKPAASTRGDGVVVFGETLHESCRLFDAEIRNARCERARAMAQARYAIFLYEQLRRFPVRIWPQVLCRIHILCGKALETLNTRRHCPITSRLREIDRFAADLLDYDAL